ncbi:MAG: molybdopterin-dependent oxidoreductase [Chloroflexi bacterium]|nr:molybdopterin-dependent oxidoreductase [Chloroflexota bacterium]
MVVQKTEVKKIRSYCAQCNSLCPTVYTVRGGLFVKAEPDKASPNWTPLCPKGLAGPELVYDPQRVKYPMRRTTSKDSPDPGWERISWDEAMNTVARKLTEIKSKYGARSIAFCRTSPGGSPGGDMHEWVTRLANSLGSPNSVSHTHVCQWHRDHCSNYTYGRGGIGMPDIDRANCILIWGANIYANDPRRYAAVKKAQQRGAKLIVVDPRRTPVAARSDLWLQVKPGTDGALVLALIRVLLKGGLYDIEFTRDWTNAAFLVRRDTGNLLREKDIAPSGLETRYVVWNAAAGKVVPYDPASASHGELALAGSYKVRLVSGPGVGTGVSACGGAGGHEAMTDTVFELLAKAVEPYIPEKTEALTGVPAAKIEQAARMIGLVKPLCYYTFTGIEQHTNTSQTNRALSVLYSLTGNYDAEGGNMLLPPLPVNRVGGHAPVALGGRERRLGEESKPLGPPVRPGSVAGYDIFTAILEGKPYPLKAMVAFGGDLITADSDSLRGREALRKLDFYVHIDLCFSPPTQFADIVLPASTFYEAEVAHLGFPGSRHTWDRLQWRAAAVPPQWESRPDLDIVFDLAARLEVGDKLLQGTEEAAFNELLSPSGVTVEDLKSHPGGVSLNLPLRAQKYKSVDAKTGKMRGFETPTRRIEIFSQLWKDHGFDPLPVYEPPRWTKAPAPDLEKKYPLTLVSTRVIQFCHGQHRSLPSLRKAVPEPFLEIHPATAKALGIEDRDDVAMETDRGSIRLVAKVTDMAPPDVVSTQVGWWQPCPQLGLPGYDPYSSEGANLNLVLPDDVQDPVSGSLPFKSYKCRVRKA